MRSALPHAPSRWRRVVAGAAALLLAGALLPLGAAPASAVQLDISIQATNATTQPSGAEFTYQINLACLGTNAPSCSGATIEIPIDPSMADWGYEVAGGVAGSVTVSPDGTTLIIALSGDVAAGNSQAIALSVTPPNLVTPNGTTWSLLPSIVSTDPLLEPSTAPAAASGTATAETPLSVSKTSDRTFYEDGETVTYSITATCPTTLPQGSLYAASMVVVDTLPEGLDYVASSGGGVWDATARTITWTYPTAASVPVRCGGTAPDAAPDQQTVTATVGTVQPAGSTGPGLVSYDQVVNVVEASVVPLGETEVRGVQTDDRTIVVLAEGDEPLPGTHSLGKDSWGPLAHTASSPPRGTYAGRWLPNGIAADAPATADQNQIGYRLTPRIQYEDHEYEIVDGVPCLTSNDGSTVLYTSVPGVCAAPAFHVLSIRIAYSGPAPAAGYAPQYRTTDGDWHDATLATSAASGETWVVATEHIGDIDAVRIPRDDSQRERRSDTIEVRGFADASLAEGSVLQNRAEIDWFLRDSTTTVDSQQSNTADLYILDGPQLGITKTMPEIGGPSGPTIGTVLTATLATPAAPQEDVVIADLLPAGTTLLSDPDAITVTVTPQGGSAVVLGSDAVLIEAIEDYAEGRTLLRVTVPHAALPAASGRLTLRASDLELSKPVTPGVYENSARVFYDNESLLPECSAGDRRSDDPLDLRGHDGSAVSCEATASFRSATSSTGAFEIRKSVQGDFDEAPREFPNVAHVRLEEGTAEYWITWRNTGAPDLTGVVAYDVFPHPGDHGVSGGQAGEERGSQFAPRLAEVAELPAGVALEYSESTDPCRPEVYPTQNLATCADDWTATPPADLATVSAIRIVSSETYRTGEGFSVNFRMSVPTVDRDQVAWNSVAVVAQTAGGVALLPAEPPKVGITASEQRFAIDKSTTAEGAKPGDEVEFDIRVTNAGTLPTVQTAVMDLLPEEFEFVSASDGGEFDAETRAVTWTVPALDRDESVTFTVRVRVAQGIEGVVVNRAVVENPEGYSPPLGAGDCEDDLTSACASLELPDLPVPAAPTGELGRTGAEPGLLALGVAGVLVLLGGALVVRRRRA